eukprot:g11660.t1
MIEKLLSLLEKHIREVKARDLVRTKTNSMRMVYLDQACGEDVEEEVGRTGRSHQQIALVMGVNLAVPSSKQISLLFLSFGRDSYVCPTDKFSKI